MKYKCLIILAFLSCKLSAQYTPYVFENFEREWTHHSYVEELLADDVQSYTLVQKLMTEDDVYLLYGISDKFWYYNGFLIEKLDKSTGELLWDYHAFERSFFDRDYPSNIYVRDDGVLVLSSFRQQPIENQNSIWVLANLNTWEFDDQTGVLLDNIVSNPADTNNVLLAMPVSIVFSGTTQSYIDRTANRINNIRSMNVSLNVRIESFDLTVEGHSIKDTTVFLPFIYPRALDSKTMTLSDDRIFNYRESETLGGDSSSIVITMMDKDLNILYAKDLSIDIEERYRELCFVDDDVFCVMQFGEPIFPNEPYRHQKMIAYDYEGNIIDQFELKRADGTSLYSIAGFNIMYISELEKTLIVSYNKDGSEAYWEWFLTTEDGKIEQIGKTFIENPDDRFLWDFDPPVFMDWLGNGEILIHALHLATGSNTTGTKIPSISIVSLDDIKNTVAVFDIEESIKVKIYPNPTNNLINIELPVKNDNIVYIELYNSEGKKVASIAKNYQMNSLQYDMKHLSSGIYYIHFYNAQNDLLAKKKVIRI